MNITCKTIRNLPYAGQLRLVAGADGLNRTIEWVHYLEEPGYMEWLKGGELIVTTGIMISENENEFRTFVQGLYEQNVAGLVVNMGPHFDEIPKSIIKMADELAFPIFEMPLEIRIEDLSQSICYRIVQKNNQVGELNKILLDLIYGRRITQTRIQKLMEYNFYPDRAYCSIVVMCDEEAIQKEETGEFQLFEEENEEDFLNKTARCINSYMESVERKILYVVDNGSIILMIPVRKKERVSELIREMIPWLRERTDIRSICVGIGYPWMNLDDFRGSVECAQHAIFFGEQMDPGEEVFDYADMSAIRIFDEIEDKRMLRAIEQQVLGIIESGEDEPELLRTLEIYLCTDGNVKETAAALSIHENTMRYRIRKIENLLNRDLRDHNDVFELELAIRIRDYLEYMQYDRQFSQNRKN